MHRTRSASGKSSALPSLRADPELREATESVLRGGQKLSSLMETSIRKIIRRRRIQEEFIARGLRSRDKAKLTDLYRHRAR